MALFLSDKELQAIFQYLSQVPNLPADLASALHKMCLYLSEEYGEVSHLIHPVMSVT